jgi:hypothetical protein
MPLASSSRARWCAAGAFSFLLVFLVIFLSFSGVLQPTPCEANKRVRINWDNYKPAGGHNLGNVTAGVNERFKKIYTKFLNSLELVTSDNNVSIDVWLTVHSQMGPPGEWGDAHHIGNSSADIWGGWINSRYSTFGFTNQDSLINGLARTLAHEKGHCDGLEHTSNKTTLMCDGGLVSARDRFGTDVIAIPDVQATQLNRELAMVGSISPRTGVPSSLVCIRGVGSEGWDETSINIYGQLLGPPTCVLGWVNELGDFMPSTVTATSPGILTLFGGDVVAPAVYNQGSGLVEEADARDHYITMAPLPRTAALYPVPAGDYFSAVTVSFPMTGAQAILDAAVGGGVPHYYGNGMDFERAAAIPGSSVGVVLILSLVLLAYGFYEVRRRARAA